MGDSVNLICSIIQQLKFFLEYQCVSKPFITPLPYAILGLMSNECYDSRPLIIEILGTAMHYYPMLIFAILLHYLYRVQCVFLKIRKKCSGSMEALKNNVILFGSILKLSFERSVCVYFQVAADPVNKSALQCLSIIVCSRIVL